MRGLPQVGFADDIRRISCRTSESIRGRPGFPFRDFHRQYSRKPSRCQPTTVSGLTMISASDQFRQTRRRRTQKARSSDVNLGRGFSALNTASCWRSAMFSMTKSERDLIAARMSLMVPASIRFMAVQDADSSSYQQALRSDRQPDRQILQVPDLKGVRVLARHTTFFWQTTPTRNRARLGSISCCPLKRETGLEPTTLTLGRGRPEPSNRARVLL